MPVTGTEKAKAKRKIMKEFTPWLLEHGFVEESPSRFEYPHNKGSGTLTLNVPSFDSFYRMIVSFQPSERDSKRFSGPISEPYVCPNHPGKKRYTFRFTHAEETWERCLSNMREWIEEVALPWLQSENPQSWSNPNITKT
jgi:hypothetical protein